MTVSEHRYRHPLLTPGDPDESAVNHFPTVFSFLEAGARRWPDDIWCRTPTGDCTRRDAFEAGRRVAAGLIRRGVKPSDRVVVTLPNGLDFVYVWFGLVLARAVTVAINPRAVEAELPAVVEDVEPRLVVVSAGEPVTITTSAVSVADLLSEEPLGELPGQEAGEDEAVSFIQSSGSTGRPKFVIQTNRMYTMAAEGFPYWLSLSDDDVLLTTLPLSHINAQIYSLQGSYGVGAQLVLVPRFSASTFWRDVVEYGATQFNAIGAMLEALMNRPTSEEEQNNSVRICYSGPAPTMERHREIEDRFGLRLVIGYALSESPYGLVVPVDRPNVYESMGVARQHPTLGEVNEARVVDGEGNLVEGGVVGELELRNPAISPGYFGNPDETKQMVRDGWLRTGDLAVTRPDGYLAFAGRTKEIIRRRGENVSPVEVELVLDAHPAVVSSAVVGVPSDMTDEDIKAFVLCRTGEKPLAQELADWCAERLPSYKRPRYVEYVEAWPLTETQKIAKKLLPRDRTDNEVDLEGR